MPLRYGNWVTPVLVSVVVTGIVLYLSTRGAGGSKARAWAAMAVVALAFAASLAACASFFGYDSPVFGVGLVTAVLGLVASGRSVAPLPRPGDHPVAGWETDGVVFRILGIDLFGAMLRRRPLRYLNPVVYVRAQRRDLAALAASMLAAERIHFWALVLTAPFIICWMWRGSMALLAWVAAFHLLMNIYPILHLRRARGRVERVIRRQVDTKVKLH
jgi:hypothetical protein